MTQRIKETHIHYYYPPGQLVVPVPVPVAPVPTPAHPGQQGYWIVPLPPGAVPGQPIEWAPIVAYGQFGDSQQPPASGVVPPAPPPSSANPEWIALADGEPVPIDDTALPPHATPLIPGVLPPVQWRVSGSGSRQRHYTWLPPLPPGPAPDAPEWRALGGGGRSTRHHTLIPPPPPPHHAAAPASGARNPRPSMSGDGQGVDWFVVPIPSHHGNGGNGPPGGPSAPSASRGGDGQSRANL
ncbi:hypothetical protein L873DRAFT_1788533 [Choiromyces venosus 120613-1]|uniref:Uncharacterized protein n=1 Tax=Choiromyces venosus 120613-1 TaxID=1336337 RepID=A0A3N4JSD0_9PEZI|nr:hypothetical protein L873DRAFT_1788533 [Choiromyces venosus 120613-1]